MWPRAPADASGYRRRALLALAFTLALGAGVACRDPGEGDRSTRAVLADAPAAAATGDRAGALGSGATSSASGPAPPTLDGPKLFALEVEGFSAAVLSVPIGATSRRPVIVATHGNYDRPEWQCEVWAGIVGGRAFVLCPRGVERADSPSPDDRRFTYTQNQDLEREVDAALAALGRSRYGAFVAEGPPVWAGFSLGAIMGVAIARRRPADFPALVLIEGGADRLGADAARAFAKGGGQRVLIACAQAGCGKAARARAQQLQALGVSATVVDAGAIGHTYDGAVAEAVKAALPAFLAEDPRFAGVFGP